MAYFYSNAYGHQQVAVKSGIMTVNVPVFVPELTVDLSCCLHFKKVYCVGRSFLAQKDTKKDMKKGQKHITYRKKQVLYSCIPAL